MKSTFPPTQSLKNMFSLATIQRMNSVRETVKARRRARALNRPGGHAKSKEKGQTVYTAEDMQSLGEKYRGHLHLRGS